MWTPGILQGVNTKKFIYVGHEDPTNVNSTAFQPFQIPPDARIISFLCIGSGGGGGGGFTAAQNNAKGGGAGGGAGGVAWLTMKASMLPKTLYLSAFAGGAGGNAGANGGDGVPTTILNYAIPPTSAGQNNQLIKANGGTHGAAGAASGAASGGAGGAQITWDSTINGGSLSICSSTTSIAGKTGGNGGNGATPSAGSAGTQTSTLCGSGGGGGSCSSGNSIRAGGAITFSGAGIWNGPNSTTILNAGVNDGDPGLNGYSCVDPSLYGSLSASGIILGTGGSGGAGSAAGTGGQGGAGGIGSGGGGGGGGATGGAGGQGGPGCIIIEWW